MWTYCDHLMPVPFMICISFSLFIVFSFVFIMNPFNHVHAFSSILFFSTLKIRIHVFRQIRCRPQSAILRALWTSVLTRTVKTMLFDSRYTKWWKSLWESKWTILSFRHDESNGVDSSIQAFFRDSGNNAFNRTFLLASKWVLCCNHNVDMSA